MPSPYAAGSVIDIHCHVLWGIDDGPPTLAEALALAGAAAQAGTRTIVATPHVSWDHPDNTSASIARRVVELNHALDAAGIDLTVVPGAEIALSRVTDLPAEELAALTLGGGPYLLVEPPFSPAAAGFEAVLDHLLVRGHRLVIAHPERCPAFLRDRSRLEHYVAQGCLTSFTAGSVVGLFGPEVQDFTHDCLRDGLVFDLASDSHSATGKRAPGIGPQLEEAGFGPLVDHLCRAVPEAILSGAPIPAPPAFDPPPGRRRGLFRRR
jgi:protein-tyrosine phosphatase